MMSYSIAPQMCGCASEECKALGCRAVRDRQRAMEAERALFMTAALPTGAPIPATTGEWRRFGAAASHPSLQERR